MDVPRLVHVRVNVRDLGAALPWYEWLFGFPADGHRPAGAPTYVHFMLGPAQFALGECPPAPGSGTRVTFEVADVDAWWDRVAPGTEVLEPLYDTPYGTRRFTIRDPDGNELGFVRA